MKTSLVKIVVVGLALIIVAPSNSAIAQGGKSKKEKRESKSSKDKSKNSANRPQSSSPARNPITGSRVSSNSNSKKSRSNSNHKPNTSGSSRPNAKNDKKKPSSKGGGNNNKPGNNSQKSKGKPPKPAEANNQPKLAPRTSFAPGGVSYPSRFSRPATQKPTAKRPSNSSKSSNHSNRDYRKDHPNRVAHATAAKRPNPVPLNQVIAANSMVNSNNRSNSIINNNTNINNSRTTNINNSRTNVTNITNKTTKISNNWGKQWSSNRSSVWNDTHRVNNRQVQINQNFQRSLNYAYRPASWGSRPWWSNSTYHDWHHGSWNYGWNRTWQQKNYHPPRNSYLPGYRPERNYSNDSSWGISAWSLGSLAYDLGYNSYRNPYKAPPVQSRSTVINYTMPISVVASTEEPETEDAALTSEEKSTAATERARAQFRSGDYVGALSSTDEAISYAYSDSALHEFRALSMFALGRYGDAAGVLNPVLASGPGWDWATMSAFYSDSETYTAQLRRLESYVQSRPDSADAQFVLGYHYMVSGFIDAAFSMFDRVVTLQPADTVAAQLRTLAQSSSPDSEDDLSEEEDVADEDVDGSIEQIDPADLDGGWKAMSGDGKPITLILNPSGDFSWNYEGAADGKVLSGDWAIDDDGQLVLTASDVQMVASVSLEEDTLAFVLAGSPVGDPGLSFERL